MSRDWTPKEWDMVHKEMPQLRDTFNSPIIIKYNDEEKLLNTQEELDNFALYPKLNLVGREYLQLCLDNGLFNSENGRKVIQLVEDILTNNSNSNNKEFEEKVKLWYNGKLNPGHYMDENNQALYEETIKLKQLFDNNGE